MTHPDITNPYLRALAAREIVGWRTVRVRSKSHPGGMTRDDLNDYVYVITAAIARVDLHLRRHPSALLAGDTTPLSDYHPASFAGHS